MESKKRENRKSEAVFEARSVVYLLGVGLDHDIAVDEDGADDGAGEEGVGEHMDGDPDQRMVTMMSRIWEIYLNDVHFGCFLFVFLQKKEV